MCISYLQPYGGKKKMKGQQNILKRRNIHYQQMLNITSHQGNVNQIHNEI